MSFDALYFALLCLGALVVSVSALTDAPPASSPDCEHVADELWDDPRWGIEEEWNSLLDDTRRAVRAHAGRTPCGAELRAFEALQLEDLGAFADLDSALTAFFEAGYGDAMSPFRLARQLRIRGRNDERLGRIGASASHFFRAAGLADELDGIAASQTYLDAAISAQSIGQSALRDLYLNAGETVLRDSFDLDGRKNAFALSIWGSFQEQRAAGLWAAATSSSQDSERQALLERALEFAERAVTALRSADRPEDSGELAAALEQRAQIELDLGQHHRASRSAEEAGLLIKRERGLQPGAEAEHQILLGNIAAAQRQYSVAREHYAASAEGAVNSDLPLHEIKALVARGRLEESVGRGRAAERAYRNAIALQEAGRERAGLREWTASAFAQRQVPYRGLARVLLANGDVGGALVALDATRARAYSDLRRFRLRHRAFTGAKRTRINTLLDSLEAARLRRGRPGRGRLNAEVAVVAYQDSLNTVLGVEPLPATPLDLPALQTHLASANRDVVSYALGDSVSTAYIVTADTVAAVALPADRRAVARAARALLNPWLGDTPDPAANLDAALALYESVFEPVEALLTPGAALTVVPDAVLAHVPFGMLVRAPAESYADADYLTRHRAVTTELAVGLVGEPPSGDAEGGVVVFGRSAFDGPPSDTRGRALGALPHVADEVAQIGRRASASAVALDGDATESALAALAPSAGVLHIATHAVTDPELPMNSHIVLSAAPESGEDGRLHLYEMQNRDLDAGLVVLSGCSTADGELQAGEGLMGMGYAVRIAGAAASIATLWAVDDRATVFLMDALYAGLADGLPKDEALRQAQLAYLDAHDGLGASPFYWAAPVLSGAPEPVALGGRSWAWLWILTAGLGGALAWRLTRRT